MANIDYLYNPDLVKHKFNNYLIDKKLGFQVIENGMILPHKDIMLDGKWTFGKGGVVDSEGKFITSSHVNTYAGQNASIYTPPQESIQHSTETVIYLTIFFRNWGHTLTDNISRLWFLNNQALRNEFKNCPIVYVPWDNNKRYYVDCMPDTMRFLEILGLDLNRLQPITQPTQFDKIILFDRSFDYTFTNEYCEMIDRVRSFALKNRTPVSNKKIYFYYGDRQVGEERLAEYFKSKGYEIITHEQRSASFDETINLLINTESFASSEGTCAHNSIFLRDGTETIFILRARNATTFQPRLDQVSHLNSKYIDSTMSIFSVGHGAYFFIISEQLKRFFGDKWNGYEEEDFKNFLDYVNDPIRMGNPINPRELEYYDSVFTDFMAQLKQRKDLITAYNMPLNWDTFRPTLTYTAIVHKKGWRDGWTPENQFSNPLDQELEVLAIVVRFPNHNVYYQVYFNEEEGWSKVETSGIAGTVGVRKPIYGMRVYLDEEDSNEFDILYRMHKFDGTWTPWAKNGETLYSHGVKVNAIQIKLEPVNIQSEETNPEEFDDMYSPWVENDVTIYLQGQRALIRAKTIKSQPDKTRTNEFDDVYTPWTKSDEKIYLSGRRPQLRATIKKEVI